MRKYIYLYVFVLFFQVLSDKTASVFASYSQNGVDGNISYNADIQDNKLHNKGSRPAIDYSTVDFNDYLPGVFRVKISYEHSAYFTGSSFTKNKSGAITTGLKDFDQLSQQYHIYDGRMIAEDLFDGDEKSSHNFSERHKEWGFHLWYEFRTADKSDLLHIVEHFQSLESVEVAQPVFRIISTTTDEFYETVDDNSVIDASKNQSVTNDARFMDQWNLHNIGQRGGISGVDISITDAWAIERGRNDVVVAIIDGGVQADHPDLALNIWKNADGLVGYNFADKTNDIVPSNHATHVAGIVSAVSNNEIGVAGIAGGCGDTKGVAIMVCQVFSDDRCDGFHMAPIFAADNGAAISQNSWTYAAPNVYDHLALDAIDYFNTYGGGNVMNGGITIFAAGNNGREDIYYPAAYKGTVAVASMNNLDEKASTSNYGDWIDISAPGVSILSTLANGSYGYSSGTSMAAPHVAGVAALIISNATTMMKASDVIDIMISTVDDHYVSNEQYAGKLGNGRINAYAALLAMQPEGYQPDEPVNNQPDKPEDEEQDDDEDDGANSPEIDYHFLRDGNWNDLNNWFADKDGDTPAITLPSPNNSIFISAKAISSDPVIIEVNGEIHIKPEGELITDELIIEPCESKTEKLVVYPNGMLTVADDLINKGGREAILIISDESGSGSIIHVSQHVQASYTYNNAHKIRKPWNTISIPLMNQNPDHQVIDGIAYTWNEPAQAWITVNHGAHNEGTDTSEGAGNCLDAGVGYLVGATAESSATTSVLSGVLTAGEFFFELSRLGNPDDSFAGFNLVGNPYPSGIDWNEDTGWEGRSNLDGKGSSQGVSFWSWNPQTGNYGAYNNSSHHDAGTNHVSRYINPMQAFWVQTDKHGSTFSVNNKARIHYSESNAEKATNVQPASIRLVVDNYTDNYSDDILLEFGHESFGGARKLFSLLPDAPSLYTKDEDYLMSIHFLQQPNLQPKLDLGFMAGIDAVHTITAHSIQGITEDVFLFDKQTGHRHNLSQRASYHFSASVNDDPDRFEIHFGEDIHTSVAENDLDEPEVYYTTGQLNIYNPWTSGTQVQVFNMAGACVAEFSTAAFAYHQNTFNVKSGVYVVKISTRDQQYATRIMAW